MSSKGANTPFMWALDNPFLKGSLSWNMLQGNSFQNLSKVVSTHLSNTPLNLYQHAIKGFRDSFHNWLGGLPGVCSGGVLQFSWNFVMSLTLDFEIPRCLNATARCSGMLIITYCSL